MSPLPSSLRILDPILGRGCRRQLDVRAGEQKLTGPQVTIVLNFPLQQALREIRVEPLDPTSLSKRFANWAGFEGAHPRP